VLTDSDLTSYYYVEACQTLRVAIGNLLRGGSSRRGAESIKPQLADISEFQKRASPSILQIIAWFAGCS